MVRQEAFVAGVSENGWAQVITDKRDACGSCRASFIVAHLSQVSKMLIRVLNRTGARASDVVSRTEGNCRGYFSATDLRSTEDHS
jgi:hypothetical protein